MLLQSSFLSNTTSTLPSLASSSQDLNSTVAVNYCNFCYALLDSKSLICCSGCLKVSYCNIEHKNFDWERHKTLCVQWKKEISQNKLLNVNSANIDNTSDDPLPSTSLDKDLECIIQTNDPDIQIIEKPGNKKTIESSSIQKRLFNKNERLLKDHSKNFLYKVSFQEHVKALTDRGISVNQHQATALRLKYIAEHVIRSLNEFGWAIIDNFLGDKYCSRAYLEVEQLYEKGMFSAGQLMDSGKYDLNPEEIRSDKIFWFGRDNGNESVRKSFTIRLLISMIDSIVVHFKNRIPPYDIAGRSKAMIAIYPGNGARYVKHVDNPIKDGRCITTIYYCNGNWKLADHGGTLRLYPETSAVPMDVDPQADRLIFFWSDRRIPHEVLPVFRDRYAITIWYFDYKERRKALEKHKKNNFENVNGPSTATAFVTPTSSNIKLNNNGFLNLYEQQISKKNIFELLKNTQDVPDVKKSLEKQKLLHENGKNLTLTRNSSDSSVSVQSNLSENQLFKKPKLNPIRCSDINLIKSGSKRINGYSSVDDDEDIDDVVAQIEAKRKQTNYFEI